MPLSQEQLRNAGIIYSVGRSMGLGTRDIQIALITAMTESNLINVHYGDRDSLGLFQQRPSAGWGSPEQVLDPQYAAKKFYSSLVGLGQKRFQMDMGAAAQAVQRSAFPDRYATHLGTVRGAWPLIEHSAGGHPVDMDGKSYMPIQEIDGGAKITNTVIPNGEDMLAAPTDTSIPSASTMLGAWGINSPQPVDPPDPQQVLSSGATTFLSEGTNQQVLQQIQTAGPYQAGVDGWRKAVIDAARSALGKPYVWGGTNLNSGVDCSGLIQASFGRIGLSMPRISYQQANYGKHVGLDGLQPGDLVAWDNSSRNSGADHIALYVGNGMIIESPRPGLSVRMRKLGSGLEGGWGVHLNFD
jgi:cell wall-associated NlpC family hydrolase